MIRRYTAPFALVLTMSAGSACATRSEPLATCTPMSTACGEPAADLSKMGAVVGVIRLAGDNQPINDATIVAVEIGKEGEWVQRSDATGSYKLSLPAGTYDLTFYFGDRVSTTKGVDIKTGVATNVSTEMRPIDPSIIIIKRNSYEGGLGPNTSKSGITVKVEPRTHFN
jgi:hypothetical protein